MAKYIPQLKIQDLQSGSARDLAHTDPAYTPVVKQIADYSITPRTLKSVTLTATPQYPSCLHARLTEEYEYFGNKVIRFGINAKLIDINTPTSIITKGDTISKTSHTTSTTTYTSSTAQSAILHQLEKEIILEAINSLLLSNTGLHPQAILVDIFERTNGAKINVDNDGHPCIHTVILYRNPSSGKVQVLDPSNFLNSSHLANNDFNAELKTKALPVIETVHKKIEIYKPKDSKKVGPDFDKYRDCTDIAVKLAFGFSQIPITAFDQKSIECHPVVVRISNQAIDKDIVDKTVVARIKQASSLTAQEDFAKIQTAINKKLVICECIEAKLSPCLRDEYLKIMNNSTNDSIQTLHGLVTLNNAFNEQIHTIMQLEHKSLYDQFRTYTDEVKQLGYCAVTETE